MTDCATFSTISGVQARRASRQQVRNEVEPSQSQGMNGYGHRDEVVMSSLWGSIRRAFLSPAPYVSWLGLTVVLAVSGPFGTYVHCTIWRRAVCFATLVGIALVWGVLARAIVQHFFHRLGYWAAAGLVVVGSSIVLPVPLLALTPFLTTLPAESLPSPVEVAAFVLVLGCVAASLRWVLGRETLPGPRAAMPGAGPRLLNRLDPALRGSLVRISGRDHYVDIVTDKGQAALLLRLSDALNEIEGVDGLQVHRSHWVAVDAMRGWEASAERRFLLLADGSRVPVSRNYLQKVADRGLIQRGIGSGRATGPVSTATARAPKSAASAASELASPPV